MKRLLVCTIAVLAFVALEPAIAQTVVVAPLPEPGSIAGLYKSYVEPILATGLAVFFGWVLLGVQSHFKIQVTASAMATVHSAIDTGLHMGLSKLGDLLPNKPIEAKNAILNTAIQWAAGPGARDSLARLGIDPASPAFLSMVQGKLEKILGLPSVPAMPSTTVTAIIPAKPTPGATAEALATAAAPAEKGPDTVVKAAP